MFPRHPRVGRPAWALVLATVLVTGAAGSALVQEQEPARLRGDAANGRVLYEAYTCYACHGYTGETGFAPRLNPPRLDQAAFVAYLRNPREPTRMPPYQQAEASDQKLADIFAFLDTLPSASPDVTTIPLLQAILDEPPRG